MLDIVHLHFFAAWTPLLGARRYRSMHGGSARAGRLGFGADPKLSCRLRHSRPLERLAPLRRVGAPKVSTPEVLGNPFPALLLALRADRGDLPSDSHLALPRVRLALLGRAPRRGERLRRKRPGEVHVRLARGARVERTVGQSVRIGRDL